MARADLVAFLHARNMPVPPELQSGANAAIVVADSEASFREEIARRLAARFPAAQVLEASSGTEALVKVGQLRPHLVVLDVGLPDLHASEVCRRLAEVPGFDQTRILAVTRRGSGSFESVPTGVAVAIDRSAGPEAIVVGASHVIQASSGGSSPD